MTGRTSGNRNRRTTHHGPSGGRSRDLDERRTNRIRLAQTAVEAVRLAWEIGNRFWR